MQSWVMVAVKVLSASVLGCHSETAPYDRTYCIPSSKEKKKKKQKEEQGYFLSLQ